MGHDGQIYEYPRDGDLEGSAAGAQLHTGIDDRAIFCYFKTNLQPETLKSELTDKHSTFLVNLMTDNN